MIYTKLIQDAIRFSIKTHEVYQKQKRKGKDIPYITHPLTVGLILAHAGASDVVVAAGLLHDTIEDSVAHKKVTREMLEERFGTEVAELVVSVTESDKSVVWEARKREAIEHAQRYSPGAVLVKSADVIANGAETLDDHRKHGDGTFDRFGASKERILQNQLDIIAALIEQWPESPLVGDLAELAGSLRALIATT